MPEDETLRVVAADDSLWSRYCALAARSYGHLIPDLTRLFPHADARVAVRGDQVIAGGLGLLMPQFFGGRPVLSACMAAGCVAPEERGRHLTTRVLTERIRPLQEQGAVLATVWTTSTGYAHRLGWAAPTSVFSWAVPTNDLKRSFDETGYEIAHGSDVRSERLQKELAARWNGPWQRPPWWAGWQADKHSQFATYRFNLPGQDTSGVLSLAFAQDPAAGQQVVVHDFWASTSGAATAMLTFLGRFSSRIPTVSFQRTGLPAAGVLLEQLDRIGSASARHWHPWMLRILDLRQAVRSRGWPEGLDTTIPIEVVDDPNAEPQRFTLRIANGVGDLEPSTLTGRCTLTRRHFAVWYAGGYQTATAAALAGVDGDPRTVADLVHATTEREPWLPEHF
ncbi:GNAT family N-acetyltransferase [Actinomadura livida]|uniref:GNAT family N-acetyltransferase n=1 Tax=Actinomadura livida TaxID=79909 RepID=A0A7W7MVK6_9ACTN|nr:MULTISPECIES: GNAT family N-acetyltransferase [Actinomadura]MBB4771919.1 putative acetyltransferase [Actinomadura catellatispora]GGU03395.1 spore coat protein [Actinomadura livida]